MTYTSSEDGKTITAKPVTPEQKRQLMKQRLREMFPKPQVFKRFKTRERKSR